MHQRRYWWFRHGIALAFIALLIPAAVLAQPHPIDTGYTMIDLGGGAGASARDINERGQVVGWSSVASGFMHAFLWSVETGMVDLGTLGGDSSSATAINEHGQVVGWSTTAAGQMHAFFWSVETGMLDLGTVSGDSSGANALNDHGQVVGVSPVAPGGSGAFLWSARTGMIDLGTLGGADSIASAINARGQVVGVSSTADGVQHAFLWSMETGMRDLGTLGSGSSGATAVNKHGQVAGLARTADMGDYAFFWSAETGMRYLGLGGAVSNPALNDRGQVVGDGVMEVGGDWHAFFWSAGTGMIDLGTLGGAHSRALALNNHGQVVGWSDAEGWYHAFMWSARTGMTDLGSFGRWSIANAINERGQIVGESLGYGRQYAVLWNPRDQKLPAVKPAQISILLRPNPNQQTCGDGIVTYTIEVTNRGEGNADNTFITLPLDPAKVRVLDAQMDHPGAWVSALSPTMLEIETGLLSGGGDTMTATLRLVTVGDIPDGTVIDARLAYRWEDEAGGGSGPSNRVTLTKGSTDLSQAVYPLLADGTNDPASGILHFSSAIFAPNEVVAVWFNQPDGTARDGGFIHADGEGAISVPVALADFGPGSYGVVARGSWTEFTALGLFEVR